MGIWFATSAILEVTPYWLKVLISFEIWKLIYKYDFEAKKN